MRDAHRMKEKFDLSLDNRQIVSLLVGGIVVLGAVFVLGVVVGKKLSEGGAAQQGALLANVDDDAAKMEKVRELEQPEVTFHKELTEKGEEQRVAVLPPKPAEPAPAQVEPAVEKPAETAPAAETVTAAATVTAEPKPEPVAVEEKKPAQTVTANVKVAAETTSLEKAYARAQQTPATRTVASAGAGGAFTLQLSASQSRAEADRFAAKVKDRGYPAYIVEADVPGKGTWYRVRLGRFPSKDEASRYLSDFRRETRMDAFIAPAN